MPSKKINAVFLGRDFPLSCNEGEEHNLQVAAEYLARRMEDFQKNGMVIRENIAIMAALSITHELLNSKVGGGGFEVGAINSKLDEMNKTLEAVLAQNTKQSQSA